MSERASVVSLQYENSWMDWMDGWWTGDSLAFVLRAGESRNQDCSIDHLLLKEWVSSIDKYN